MEILVMVGSWLLPLLASLLTILAIAGVKKLMDKWSVERSDKIDDMIDRYVRMGVNAAEVAGTKYLEMQGVKMASGDKKSTAISAVLRELEQSGVKGVAEELIATRIEHWLEVDGKNPGTPSDPTVTGEDA